jgi:hypothetical protein
VCEGEVILIPGAFCTEVFRERSIVYTLITYCVRLASKNPGWRVESEWRGVDKEHAIRTKYSTLLKFRVRRRATPYV